MARRAEGWKLILRGRIYRVRFTYKGERYEITTGESDSRKAEIVAAQIYSDVVSGRVTVAENGTLVHPTTALDEMCADWIAAIEPELGRDTAATYMVYVGHWAKFFQTIGNVTTGRASNYGRERLRTVTRTTVTKELSAFRRFLRWAFEQGMLREIPEIVMPAKKALGQRHAQGRRAPTHLSPEQVEAILAALPEKGRARGGVELVVRDFFVFCYETALRPEGTVSYLQESDFTSLGLHIRPELDKNRWERTIPLSARAAAILTRLAQGKPERLFFGNRDRRDAWRCACVAALGEIGKKINPYDLKHARVTSWFSEGKDPMGVRFLTGTNEAIDKYAIPSRAAADRVMASLRGDSGAAQAGISAKGGTRTPTGFTPLAPQASPEDESSGKTAVSATHEVAATGNEKPHSGAAPRFDSVEFRSLSLGWFLKGSLTRFGAPGNTASPLSEVAS
jgi:integrase